MPASLENSTVARGLEKSVYIPIPKKGSAKECLKYCTIALFSHTSKVMLKILQGRLQQYVDQELPEVQAGFRRGRGTRDQIANMQLCRKPEFQKTSTSASLTTQKPLNVWTTANYGKSLKKWESLTTISTS